MKLSILDLIPVRDSQTTTQAVAATRRLAQTADRAGFTRYWIAEHHNMPAVAATVPGVLVSHLAAHTERIRVGSGGVMLPNHTALATAEQFALLEAMYPGRIDLGIGRAPGADPVTAYLLRGGQMEDAVERFAQDVTLVRELLGAGQTPVGDAVGLSLGGKRFDVRATPAAASAPELWLLGSSGFSAELAAQVGLPYAFAYHFGAPGIEAVVSRYREAYQPSEQYPQPRTLLPINVVVGQTEEEAQMLAGPMLVQMTKLRTGGQVTKQLTVEQAAGYEWSDAERAVRDQVRSTWAVGDVAQVAAKLREAVDAVGGDEVMIVPGAGARDGDPMDDVPARREGVEMLAEALL